MGTIVIGALMTISVILVIIDAIRQHKEEKAHQAARQTRLQNKPDNPTR